MITEILLPFCGEWRKRESMETLEATEKIAVSHWRTEEEASCCAHSRYEPFAEFDIIQRQMPKMAIVSGNGQHAGMIQEKILKRPPALELACKATAIVEGMKEFLRSRGLHDLAPQVQVVTVSPQFCRMCPHHRLALAGEEGSVQ